MGSRQRTQIERIDFHEVADSPPNTMQCGGVTMRFVLGEQQSVAARHRRLEPRDVPVRPRGTTCVRMLLLLVCAMLLPAWAGDTGGKVFRQLHFSSDGKYLLAQDAEEIAVLATYPAMSVLFRVPADNRVPGQFTLDSKELIFLGRQQRSVDVDSSRGRLLSVERWRIADAPHATSTAIPWLEFSHGALSPEGQTFACTDVKGTLHIVDVGRGGVETLTKIKFAMARTDSQGGGFAGAELAGVEFSFSPSGRFLVALPHEYGAVVIWDVRQNVRLKALGKLRVLSRAGQRADAMFRGYSFVFVADDKLVLVSPQWISLKNGWKCAAETLTFPSGEMVSRFDLPECPGGLSEGFGHQGSFRVATDPAYLILDHETVIHRGGFSGSIENVPPSEWFRGLGTTAKVDTLAISRKDGRLIHSHSPAMDVFGGRYVDEIEPGAVGLWEVGSGLKSSLSVSRH